MDKKILQSERGDTKKRIVKFILENHGSDYHENVLEANIRDFLRESDIAYDQGRINKHLNELHKLGCLEKIRTSISKHPNKWNVKKIKNLMRIRENFKDIKLNNYKKAIDIVFAETGYDPDSIKGAILYRYLSLSSSFLNNCAEMGIEKLKSKAWELYLDEEDLVESRLKLKNLYDCCNKIKHHYNSEMARETFLEKKKKIVPEKNTFISAPEFYKLFDLKFPEFASTNDYKKDWEILCFSFLFWHFYKHDTLIGTCIPNEREFAKLIIEYIYPYYII